ncbi:toxin, partial [Enterococcus faecalis]|nr:toxin [Enterococcus faecalis]
KYTTLYDSRSNTFHSKFEAEANKIAIIILLNIFVENELTDESQFKLDNFMDFYSINSNLRTECFDVCHSYFKKNYSYAQ